MTSRIPFTPEFEARFADLAPLGEGGMGVVYKATQRSLDRPVAVKFLSNQLVTPDFLSRFEAEAKLAARIFHSNLVAVIEYGQLGEVPYIVFEFVDGPTLRGYLSRRARAVPVARALDLVRQAADGLDCAHKAGIIHRDVKPENLLIGVGDVVKVADFGVAKGLGRAGSNATRTGVVVGTPTYMSPEQCREKPVEAQSDVYSLGVVLYELLAGKVPFSGEALLEVLDAHVNKQPPPIERELPPDVVSIVFRTLAKNPADRFPTMADLSRALVDAGVNLPSGLAADQGSSPYAAGAGAASGASYPRRTSAMATPPPAATKAATLVTPAAADPLAPTTIPVAPASATPAVTPAMFFAGVVILGVLVSASILGHGRWIQPPPPSPSLPSPPAASPPPPVAPRARPFQPEMAQRLAGNLRGLDADALDVGLARITLALQGITVVGDLARTWDAARSGDLEAAAAAFGAWVRDVPPRMPLAGRVTATLGNLVMERLLDMLAGKMPGLPESSGKAILGAAGPPFKIAIEGALALQRKDYEQAYKAFSEFNVCVERGGNLAPLGKAHGGEVLAIVAIGASAPRDWNRNQSHVDRSRKMRQRLDHYLAANRVSYYGRPCSRLACALARATGEAGKEPGCTVRPMASECEKRGVGFWPAIEEVIGRVEAAAPPASSPAPSASPAR